jgi:hypothetical protein
MSVSLSPHLEGKAIHTLLVDPGGTAASIGIPIIQNKPAVKFKQKNSFIDGVLTPGSTPELVNQAGIEADRSSFKPILISDEAISQTLNSEPRGVVEQEQVKLTIIKAAEKREETLNYYQLKLREKEQEYCKLFDQVRNQVIETKLFQLKSPENKNERRKIKESIKRISGNSEVQEESRAMFLPQKANQEKTVTSELHQKV